MNDIINILKEELNDKDLENLSKLLYSSYKPYMLNQVAWELLFNIFPVKVHKMLIKMKKYYIPSEVFNAVIFRYYKGENIIKYNLAREYINKDNEVITFETNVNSSRLDIGRINGKSFAYEIKTELDNINRLKKQIEDYEKVFEKIYVVTHPIHLKDVKKTIPRKCGIIIYEIIEGNCIFEEIREALDNKRIKKSMQIKILNSKDLLFILKNSGIDEIPKYKEEREILVNKLFNKEEMNELFKLALKKRNEEKWEHVKNNFHILLPLDIQDFFTYMPEPSIYYYKSSSTDLI